MRHRLSVWRVPRRILRLFQSRRLLIVERLRVCPGHQWRNGLCWCSHHDDVSEQRRLPAAECLPSGTCWQFLRRTVPGLSGHLAARGGGGVAPLAAGRTPRCSRAVGAASGSLVAIWNWGVVPRCRRGGVNPNETTMSEIIDEGCRSGYRRPASHAFVARARNSRMARRSKRTPRSASHRREIASFQWMPLGSSKSGDQRRKTLTCIPATSRSDLVRCAARHPGQRVEVHHG